MTALKVLEITFDDDTDQNIVNITESVIMAVLDGLSATYTIESREEEVDDESD